MMMMMMMMAVLGRHFFYTYRYLTLSSRQKGERSQASLVVFITTLPSPSDPLHLALILEGGRADPSGAHALRSP